RYAPPVGAGWTINSSEQGYHLAIVLPGAHDRCGPPQEVFLSLGGARKETGLTFERSKPPTAGDRNCRQCRNLEPRILYVGERDLCQRLKGGLVDVGAQRTEQLEEHSLVGIVGHLKQLLSDSCRGRSLSLHKEGVRGRFERT